MFFISFLTMLIIYLVIGNWVMSKVLLLIMLFSMSLIFLVLGIFGGYLSKTYIQGKNRPVYIVREYNSNEKKSVL